MDVGKVAALLGYVKVFVVCKGDLHLIMCMEKHRSDHSFLFWIYMQVKSRLFY